MFCSKCGAACVKKHIPRFSEETGEQLFKYACSTGECEHTGLPHEDVDDGFLGFLKNLIAGGYRCCRCGHRIPLQED